MILRDLRPSDATWVLDQHALHYTSVEGFDDSFRPLVARVVADFLETRDPAFERAWIAESGNENKGCVFLMRETATTARLRLFYVTPDARGTGLARKFLDALLAYARDAGYGAVLVSTYERHAAAGKLYAKTGFALTDQFDVSNFGQELVEQHWRKQL